MNAANENEFQDRHRRLGRMLLFLTAFLCVVLLFALASRFRWIGSAESLTFFDAKGILTGRGTVLVMIGAALAALTLFVAFKRLTLRRAFSKAADSSKANESVARALGEWLARDVLASAVSADGPGNRIEGFFRGRRFSIAQLESGGAARMRYSVESVSALPLRVWWLGKARAEPSGEKVTAEFATNDPQFENCCAWQSPTPGDALNFLNRGDVSGTLHRLCFISGRNGGAADDTGVAFENGRIVCVARVPSFDFMRAPSALVLLQDLVFLSEAAENKATGRPLLAGTEAAATEIPGERLGEALGIRPSKFMSFLSCLMFVALVLVPLITLWIAGSYYCAKALDMSAGMLCFFVPVLLMAIFVFTRPSSSAGEGEGINDMETVRAAAMKYWEQRLRDDCECARLLDKYEQRVKE